MSRVYKLTVYFVTCFLPGNKSSPGNNLPCSTQQHLYCDFNNSCPVNLKTRKECSKCRLKKCFEVGMRVELVAPNEQQRIRRGRSTDLDRLAVRTQFLMEAATTAAANNNARIMSSQRTSDDAQFQEPSPLSCGVNRLAESSSFSHSSSNPPTLFPPSSSTGSRYHSGILSKVSRFILPPRFPFFPVKYETDVIREQQDRSRQQTQLEFQVASSFSRNHQHSLHPVDRECSSFSISATQSTSQSPPKEIREVKNLERSPLDLNRRTRRRIAFPLLQQQDYRQEALLQASQDFSTRKTCFPSPSNSSRNPCFLNIFSSPSSSPSSLSSLSTTTSGTTFSSISVVSYPSFLTPSSSTSLPLFQSWGSCPTLSDTRTSCLASVLPESTYSSSCSTASSSDLTASPGQQQQERNSRCTRRHHHQEACSTCYFRSQSTENYNHDKDTSRAQVVPVAASSAPSNFSVADLLMKGTKTSSATSRLPLTICSQYKKKSLMDSSSTVPSPDPSLESLLSSADSSSSSLSKSGLHEQEASRPFSSEVIRGFLSSTPSPNPSNKHEEEGITVSLGFRRHLAISAGVSGQHPELGYSVDSNSLPTASTSHNDNDNFLVKRGEGLLLSLQQQQYQGMRLLDQ